MHTFYSMRCYYCYLPCTALLLCAALCWLQSRCCHVDAFAIFPTTNSRRFDTFTYHLQTKHLSQHCLPAIKSDADADVAKADETKDGLPAMELEIRSMRVKEIKTELDRLGISTADAFEKEDLVKRLRLVGKEPRHRLHHRMPTSPSPRVIRIGQHKQRPLLQGMSSLHHFSLSLWTLGERQLV
jgi:hypothetical protein